jgi:hypothetical protein
LNFVKAIMDNIVHEGVSRHTTVKRIHTAYNKIETVREREREREGNKESQIRKEARSVTVGKV